MTHRYHKSGDDRRNVTPSGPTSMSNDQVANYLKSLREDRFSRPVRPSGSRPLPPTSTSLVSGADRDSPPRASSVMPIHERSRLSESCHAEEISSQAANPLSCYNVASPRFSLRSSTDRPTAKGPRTIPIRKNVAPSELYDLRDISLNTMNHERLQRQREKEEVRSLRDTLEEIDHSNGQQIHEAAQREATELVWMHQDLKISSKDTYAPYRYPDINGSRRESQRAIRAQKQTTGSRRGSVLDQREDNDHFASNNSMDSPHGCETSGAPIYEGQKHVLQGAGSGSRVDRTLKEGSDTNLAPHSEKTPEAQTEGNVGTAAQNVSSSSPKGVLSSPGGKTFEVLKSYHSWQKDDHPVLLRSDPLALRVRPRGSLLQGRNSLPNWSSDTGYTKKISPFGVSKSPSAGLKGLRFSMTEQGADPSAKGGASPPHTKHGIEIRSDEIRAATSKKLKDRSAKLPIPSAVSDRPGRPIVSFDPAWRPNDTQVKERQLSAVEPSSQPEPPSIQVSGPPSIPVINVSDDNTHAISETKPSVRTSNGKKDPLGSQKRSAPNTSMSPSGLVPASQGGWYSPTFQSGVPTARCESCSLPIAGKVVTAAGSRLHPECFTCHHCQTLLECVSFYKEPEKKREERISAAAGDDSKARSPRFYCHLDFHELFSPRCKSCKTPIEGEVVIACGAEWHVGHFFCAECGDPFDPQTPFVERDGFAWCIQCYSRRSAPRCLGCKQPVMEDVIITAINGHWHSRCFVCHECGTELGPDGRFFVKEGEPKRTAKGRIIGSAPQLPVCERCEAIRLRA